MTAWRNATEESHVDRRVARILARCSPLFWSLTQAKPFGLSRAVGESARAAALLGLNRDQIRYRIDKFKFEQPAAEPA